MKLWNTWKRYLTNMCTKRKKGSRKMITALLCLWHFVFYFYLYYMAFAELEKGRLYIPNIHMQTNFFWNAQLLKKDYVWLQKVYFLIFLYFACQKTNTIQSENLLKEIKNLKHFQQTKHLFLLSTYLIN